MEFEPLIFSLDEDSRTLFVRGSLDELNAGELKDAVATSSHGFADDLTVDLGGVNFLPSVGIGVLALAMRTADEHGRTISLTTQEGSLSHRVLTISGLPHSTRHAVAET